jgi:hypothetical protein
LHQLIGRALERTAALWPDVEQAYRFVHAVAHWLGNPHDESAALVRRRVDGVLGAMQRHRSRAGTLAEALDHFQKVMRSYRSGLFHTYAVPGLPRTNNDLEHLFGSQRYHERRATGRKTASPGAVLRGSVRLIAATATRVQAPTAADLGAANREHWRSLRHRLERGRQARTWRTRFRHDPATYLAALELHACQLALPS